MMHSGYEDDEFCSVDRLGSIETNRTEIFTNKHKNNQKIQKSSSAVCRGELELVLLIRFDSIRNPLKVR
jgi:hypothetical protein